MKKLVIFTLFAVTLGWFLPKALEAATLNEIEAKVQEHYTAGNIYNTSMKDNLLAVLADAKAAQSVGDSESLTGYMGSFQTTVNALSGSMMSTGAAGELSSMASGY